jgi:hypothetical protein
MATQTTDIGARVAIVDLGRRERATLSRLRHLAEDEAEVVVEGPVLDLRDGAAPAS